MIALFYAALCLLLFAPGLKITPRLVVLAAVLYGLHEMLLMLPLWYKLNFGLQFNWLGKLLVVLLCLLIVYSLRWVSPAESGLRQLEPGSRRIIGLLALASTVLSLTVGYLVRHQEPRPGLEVFLYQLTMPGLAEELFERGVLLGLLNKVFARTIPFFGTRTSWGGVMVVVLFILVHGLRFAHPLTLVPTFHLPLEQIADKILFGALFLWIRERSGSVWGAVATHNLGNVCLYVGELIP